MESRECYAHEAFHTPFMENACVPQIFAYNSIERNRVTKVGE